MQTATARLQHASYDHLLAILCCFRQLCRRQRGRSWADLAASATSGHDDIRVSERTKRRFRKRQTNGQGSGARAIMNIQASCYVTQGVTSHISHGSKQTTDNVLDNGRYYIGLYNKGGAGSVIAAFFARRRSAATSFSFEVLLFSCAWPMLGTRFAGVLSYRL